MRFYDSLLYAPTEALVFVLHHGLLYDEFEKLLRFKSHLINGILSVEKINTK